MVEYSSNLKNDSLFSRKGMFFTFEGTEGSGKTTQIQLLSEHLQKKGTEVILTREPGGTPLGDGVRKLMLEHKYGPLEGETELFLMLAQRTEHWRRVIMPAKQRGAVVLCDRYIDSSIAYQGYGRGLKPDFIFKIHREVLGACLPDFTFLFDLDPIIGIARLKECGKRTSLDRLENEKMLFHQKVREGYLEIAKAEPLRYIILNADSTPENILSGIISFLKIQFPEQFA